MKTGTLQVEGAELYYEIRGSGPTLLLIPGGGGDAATFDGIAAELADRFTVVAFDARGYSRSRLTGDPTEQVVEVQSDDAYRLLDHVTTSGERAYVFGSSSGAIVALDLLTRRPERLGLVVAHEPPCVAVLPNAAEHLAFFAEVHRLYRTAGREPAMAYFMAGIGGTLRDLPDPVGLPPRMADMISRINANFPLFMEYELRQFTSYRPDLMALGAVTHQLALAAGRDTRGHLPYRPAATMAEQLGTRVVEFPGGHGGYMEDPAPFAAQLAELLAEAGRTKAVRHA